MLTPVRHAKMRVTVWNAFHSVALCRVALDTRTRPCCCDGQLFKVRRLIGRISAAMEWWEELDEMEKRAALRSSGFRELL